MDLLYFTKPKAFGSTVPIQIPLVTRITHQPSAGLFIDFPKQLGFKFREDHTECLDIDSHSAYEVTVLLQSWLFFGLLAEFLNTPINIQAFISGQNEADGQSLDCTILENLLVEWNDRIQSMSNAAMTQHKEHILKCLEMATFQSEQFDDTTLDLTSSQFPTVALSVKLLILLLRSVTQSTFPGNSHSSFAQSKHNRQVPLSGSRPGGRPQLKWVPESFKPERSTLSLPVPPGLQIESAPPAAKLLIDRMLDAGWCIHLIRKLCQSYDYKTINYLSLLRRGTDPSTDHKACCQATQCIANNIALEGNASYKTKHTDPECQCSFLKVDTAKLVSIIREGEIPLVLITQSTTGPRLALVRRSPRTSYAAFSHVWADGLGNPSANAMPQCQIQQLWEHVRRTRAKHYKFRGSPTLGPTRWPFYPFQELIWIDTLCIPVGPAYDAEIAQAKSRAINHMAPTYAEAAVVFVLDAELQRINVYHGAHDLAEDEIGATELSALLLCSTWMGRTWTLQEAVVSRHCRYVLANGNCCPGERWTVQNGPQREYWSARLRQNVNSLFGKPRYNPDSYKVVPFSPRRDPRSESRHRKQISPLSCAMAEFDRTLNTHFAQALDLDKDALLHTISKSTTKPPSWRATQFARTWNRLLDRSTTKAEDQHGVFATLLDFNAYQVRSLQVTRRMAAIVRSCDELPLSLLFNTGPRLATAEISENGWIPTAVSGDRLTNTPVLKQTSRGFVLSNEPHESLYVFVFSSCLITAKTFCLKDTGSGQDFFVQLKNTPDGDSPGTNANPDSTLYTVLPSGQETCIIFDKQTGTTSPKGFLAAGVFLSVSRKDTDNVFAKYVCPLLVRTRESFERSHRDTFLPVTIATERYQAWRQVILEYSKSRGSLRFLSYAPLHQPRQGPKACYLTDPWLQMLQHAVSGSYTDLNRSTLRRCLSH
jgi:hypothetical protein